MTEVHSAPELTIVVPTFNERDNVPILVDRLRQALAGHEWEVIFVDDNSPDGTGDAVRAIGQLDPRVRCLRRIGRRGLAGATIEGMLAAQAGIVAVMDADLQHDETILVVMLKVLEKQKLDLVVASRHLDGGAATGLSAGRARISTWSSKLAAWLLGIDLSDPMSGYFMVRRDVIERLAPKLSSQGFKILLDIVATTRGTVRVCEVPYIFRKRLHGESKLDSQTAFAFAALLLGKLTNDTVSIRFLLFALIGASGILVHMLALLAGLSILGLQFTAAQIAATVLAITSNYLLNNAVTYSDLRLRGWRFVAGWAKFMLICSVGAMSNVGVASWIYGQDVRWQIAGLGGALIGLVWNYAVSMTYVWKFR